MEPVIEEVTDSSSESSEKSEFEDVEEVPKVKSKGIPAKTSVIKEERKKASNKSGKGRLDNTTAIKTSVNIGLPEQETKRKREDEKLRNAEKSKRGKSDESPSTKGAKFVDKEYQAILLSIYKGMGDQEVCADFFAQCPGTTRTDQALKKKIKEIRG